MKKYRIKNKFRFTAFVTICLILSVFIFGSVSGLFNAQAAQDPEYITYTVRSGDTLWNIARHYGPADQDVRITISQISHINNVSASTLQAGQQLMIPVSK